MNMASGKSGFPLILMSLDWLKWAIIPSPPPPQKRLWKSLMASFTIIEIEWGEGSWCRQAYGPHQQCAASPWTGLHVVHYRITSNSMSQVPIFYACRRNKRMSSEVSCPKKKHNGGRTWYWISDLPILCRTSSGQGVVLIPYIGN